MILKFLVRGLKLRSHANSLGSSQNFDVWKFSGRGIPAKTARFFGVLPTWFVTRKQKKLICVNMMIKG